MYIQYSMYVWMDGWMDCMWHLCMYGVEVCMYGVSRYIMYEGQVCTVLYVSRLVWLEGVGWMWVWPSYHALLHESIVCRPYMLHTIRGDLDYTIGTMYVEVVLLFSPQYALPVGVLRAVRTSIHTYIHMQWTWGFIGCYMCGVHTVLCTYFST